MLHHLLLPLKSVTKPIARRLLSSNKETWYFDYQRVDDFSHLKWVRLVGRFCTAKFIAVRRELLLQELINDDDIVKPKDAVVFREAADALDAILTSHYRDRLKKIKSVYNPLSEDRETVQMRSFTKSELVLREKEFLDDMDTLLQHAHFYKLPRDVMLHALDEANVGERVVMCVSPDNYEVLQFWVVGMDVAPLDMRPWYVKAGQRAQVMRRKNRVFLDPFQPRNYTSLLLKGAAKIRTKMFGKEISRMERYKRVVIAFRQKGDPKLHMKSFKDIPCENLEFLLPDARMKIGFTDKLRIATTWLGVAVVLYATTVSNLVELQLQSELVCVVAALALAVRSWGAYNSMKSRCLCNVSQTLYFGAIATDYALLTLIVDRAEDEAYKTSLLLLAMFSRRRSAWNEADDTVMPLLTADELKSDVKEWMQSRFHIHLDFTLHPAVDLLVNHDLLCVEHSVDGHVAYRMASLETLAALCPSAPVSHPANSLDIRGGLARAATNEDDDDGDDLAEKRFDWT